MKARRVLAAIAAAGVMGLGIPAAAAASSGAIVVESVSSPASDLGDLSVTLESTTPVVPSSITASFYPPDSQTSVLSVNDFQLTSGTNSGGTVTAWTVSSPITVSQLPLGIYTVGIQASDTGGDTANDLDADTLDWVVQPIVTLTASPDTVSYGQTVTMSGTDTGLYPDGSTVPLAGQTVYFGYATKDPLAVTTDSNGDFSVQLQGPTDADLMGEVYAPGDPPTIPAAWSNSPDLTVVPVPSRITNFSYQPSTANYNAPVTITGDISFDVGGTWLPFVDEEVGLVYDGINAIPCQIGCEPVSNNVAGATTGDDGSFSMEISGEWGTDEYTLGGNSLGPWISAPPTETFEVTVNHVQTTVYLTHVQGDTRDRVTVRGCVLQSVAAVLPNIMAPYPPAAVQYAHKPSGPWHTLPGAGSLRDKQVPPGNPGFCYPPVTDRIPHGAVYYRLAVSASTAYQASVSTADKAAPPLHCVITNYSVKPRTVSKGQKVTVDGEVDVANGAKLYVLFRADGSSRWRTVKTLSGPFGSFNVSIVLPASGDVSVRYPGDADTYACQTGVRHVTVR